ncbi:MAG: alpha/beta hydrolase [Deinococcales bacterium]
MQPVSAKKLAKVSVGNVNRHTDIFQGLAIAPRYVDVWLPPTYEQNPEVRYRVLYMHDGQNLFDPELAYGGQTWGIAETLMRLSDLAPTMVVGIWNSPERWRDYYPQCGFEALPDQQQALERLGGVPYSSQYADAIVGRLKPFIDTQYRTLAKREDTLMMGSSMGGLISLYTLVKHPDIFAGAGCLSTHWSAGNEYMVDALAAALPKPNSHRLYFDYGTETLDAEYEPFQKRMNQHLERLGWTSFVSHKFIGAAHNEAAWRERLEIPLRYLLGAT